MHILLKLRNGIPVLMYTVQFFLCANERMDKELITATNSENSTFKKMEWLPCKQEKKGGGRKYILKVCQIRAKLSSIS